MSTADAVPSTHAARTIVRAARAQDIVAVRALLVNATLPLDGVPDHLEHFLVAEMDGTVIGAIGLEPYGAAALLRSTVVAPQARGTGLGGRLVRALIAAAREHGTSELVLLTTTAEAWFPRFGFVRIMRDAAPVSLHASEEFRGACPSSAVVMHLWL